MNTKRLKKYIPGFIAGILFAAILSFFNPDKTSLKNQLLNQYEPDKFSQFNYQVTKSNIEEANIIRNNYYFFSTFSVEFGIFKLQNDLNCFGILGYCMCRMSEQIKSKSIIANTVSDN